MKQWRLTLDLPAGSLPWHGHTGIVVPVRTHGGGLGALKVAFPYEESLLEPLALELWNGQGAVAILEYDKSLGAILMDRLDGHRSLQELPIEQAIAHWGTSLRALAIAVDDRPQWRELPRIAATAERYCDELPQRWADLDEPFPRRLLEAALEVCQTRGSVALRDTHRDVLVHTDLHFMNILALPGTQHYVAIDPQVQVGDAEFAMAPCLWNRLQDLPERNPEHGLRQRAAMLATAGGLDEDLAVAWSIVREVENALAYFESPGGLADAQRSLWVASTLTGDTLPGLPRAHELKRLG